MWPALLGGVGVFLLGMGLLTDGLKQWAGDGLRTFLGRFAGNRFSAAGTGIVATAFIQSSSATSLITIGLVGAGLVALPNAIAILIGANVGTTATAYLVAFVGLKVSVSAWALPLIGVGAFVRMFVKGRAAAVASAVAGFGLLFLGIDLMRAAADGVAGSIDIAGWAGGGLTGVIVLVLLGIIMTVLVQSSSAAMATTLATLDAGAIDLPQAAFLAVGQNIGTTVTAIIGAIGGSVAARRAATAHVVFNIGTAVPALALVQPLLQVTSTLAQGDHVVALAVFHTAFNLIGLAIFLPLVVHLATWLERVIPERQNPLVRHLDRTALETSGGAEAAVDRALEEIAKEITHLLRSRLASARRPKDWERRVVTCKAALATARSFLDKARRQGNVGARIADQVRAMDHLHHILLDIDDEATPSAPVVVHLLAAYRERFEAALAAAAPDVDALYAALPRLRKKTRKQVLQRVETDPAFGPEDARLVLEALHWMDRAAWHLRRAIQARPNGGSDAGAARPGA